MIHAVKQRVTVEKDGKIQIYAPEFKAGTIAEVIILEADETENKKTLTAMIGKGKGCYKTAKEADLFVKNERSSWE